MTASDSAELGRRIEPSRSGDPLAQQREGSPSPTKRPDQNVRASIVRETSAKMCVHHTTAIFKTSGGPSMMLARDLPASP